VIWCLIAADRSGLRYRSDLTGANTEITTDSSEFTTSGWFLSVARRRKSMTTNNKTRLLAPAYNNSGSGWRESNLSLTRLDFITTLLAVGAFVTTDALAQANWPSAGADLNNSRYQSNETAISAETVGSLKLKWTLSTDGDVTAHPTVDGNYLYFPDSAGFLYKVEKNTGTLVWKKPISAYTGNAAGDL